MSRDVIVIGAGISGLSCARKLVQMGFDVGLLERQITTGGNAISSRFDGFLMEHGPTTFNGAFPNAIAQIQDLGLADSTLKLGPNMRKRYLRDHRGLHGISVHPMGFFTSGYLTLGERLSMAAEILRPRKSEDTEETIHQFAARRFGQGFADKVIEPMAAGIFMGDSKTLSINGAFPKLVDLEQKFGSITRGVLAARKGSEPGRMLLSWQDGIATLPRRLSELLGRRIETGVTVTKISRTRSGFEIATANSGSLHCRAVVLAVQPHVATALLETLDPDTAGATGDIAAPPISVVHFGFHRDQVSHPLDGLGFLSTKNGSNNGNQVISGAQFCSTMFKGRAPVDHVAISCYIGGARNPELTHLPPQELTELVGQELSGMLGIKGRALTTRIRHWPRGLPHFNLGHAARQKMIETTHHRVSGLFLTGNYLQGVSVTNCLETANRTAEKVAQALGKMVEPAETGRHAIRNSA